MTEGIDIEDSGVVLESMMPLDDVRYRAQRVFGRASLNGCRVRVGKWKRRSVLVT